MFEGQNYDQATKLIQKSNKILLFTHKDASGDGDALGSLLSLTLALPKLNKETHPILEENSLSNFSFLPGIEKLQTQIEDEADLLIFLDFSEFKRAGQFEDIKNLIKKSPSILIDHHPKGDLCRACSFSICDQKASSTTEILYFLLKNLSLIDKNVATCLLTGILTDTNSFKNPNTTGKTLKVASGLLSFGAHPSKIVEHAFYQKPFSVLKLWGRAFIRLWRNSKYNLLITVLDSSDFQECGIGEQGTNGVANFLNLNSLPESAGILVLSEENGKIKGSLRTQREGIDISKLAKILGGGGHQKAAGFTIEGKLKIEKGNWKLI
jgi:phosphoesterase RecJ-like protein